MQIEPMENEADSCNYRLQTLYFNEKTCDAKFYDDTR